ncbi:MAG: stage II sporulation protein R, partial [[Ruminococcus] torques]
MDRTKIKDQFGQFGRRREYGADDDRTTSRQMKKSRRMCAAAAVLFAFAAAFALTTAVYRMDAKAQSDLQRRLSEEVLRFHVLANSDSREDQALKLKVRDKVLEFLEANMADEQHMTEDETVMWIREHIDEIEDVSRRCVAEENYDYPVTAAVTTCWFPDKTYGDVTFPAGNYEALRI